MALRAFLAALIGVFLVTNQMIAYGADDVIADKKKEDALKLLERLAETRRGLAYIRDLLADADEQLRESGHPSEVQSQRRGIQLLQEILSDLDTDVQHTQKRTCRVNLGGHCSTENAVAMADQWNFLNSAHSPGRRRRRQAAAVARRLGDTPLEHD